MYLGGSLCELIVSRRTVMKSPAWVCWGLVALLWLSQAMALSPGDNSTDCFAIPDDERLMLQRPAPDMTASSFGRFEGTAVGSMMLVPSNAFGPDSTIYIYQYVANDTYGAYEEYSTQPSLTLSEGPTPAAYLDFGDSGWGVACSPDAIMPIEFDTGTDTFTYNPINGYSSGGSVFENCYISKYRILAYDSANSTFHQLTYNDFTNVWTLVAGEPYVAASSPVAAFNYHEPEFCYALPSPDTDTIACRYVEGAPLVLGSQLTNFTLPVGVETSDLTDMDFDNANHLVVGFNTSPGGTTNGRFAVYHRNIVGELTGPANQVSAAPGLNESGLAARITANDDPDQPGLLWFTAPNSRPIGSFSQGSIILYRSAAPGDDYVFVEEYLTEFSGRGAFSNRIGRNDVPQIAFLDDPFVSFGHVLYGYDDEPTGRQAEMCSEELWCAGSCGPHCDLDGDLCTIDRFNATSGLCEFVGNVDPNDNNPCTDDFCDSLLGVYNLPVAGVVGCEFNANGVECPGICSGGTCSADGPCLGVISPTPTPSPTRTTTPVASFSPTPSPSASQVVLSPATCLLDGCDATRNGTCNVLSSCVWVTAINLECYYTATNSLCPTLTGLNAESGCQSNQCVPSTASLPSGCVIVDAEVGTFCESERACHTLGMCAVGGACREIPDDSICDKGQNSLCGTNLCVRDLTDVAADIDAQGCRLVSTGGSTPNAPCISPDPCVVSTAANPTLCDPDTFLCGGGEEVVCEDGAGCLLGACVLKDCDGDDDDCYQSDDSDDDDDDDDDGLNDWDDWKAPLIVFAAVVVCCGFFIIALLYRYSSRQDDEKVERAELTGSGHYTVKRARKSHKDRRGASIRMKQIV